MEIGKGTFIGSLIVTALCCLLFGYALIPQFLEPHQNPQTKYNVYLCYELFSGKDWVEVGNVITDTGETETRDRFATNQTATDYAVNWIGVGNSSGLQTESSLAEQYGNRQNGDIATWTNAGDAAFNVTYQWQFTETVNLNATGAFYSDTGSVMYSVANFAGGAQTFNNGENLTVRWVFTYNCND